MSRPNPSDSSPAVATPARHAHWSWWRRMVARGVFVLFAVPKTVWRSLIVAYFVLATLFLLLGNVVAPRIAAYKDDIAQAMSQRLGQRVEIAALSADWRGLRPRLHLSGVKVRDGGGQVVLELPAVHAAVAWASLLRGEARLHRIELTRPELALRRDKEGHLFVAGLQIRSGGEGGSGSADLLLAQREIVIEDARVSWLDELRGAPLLALEGVSLRLLNRGERHSFAVLASPPAAMASTLDLRGELRGASASRPEDWRGSLFLNAERFDLAAWRQWIDYPVELPGGRGGVTAWLNFEGLRIGSLTTDFALRDLHLRLAEDLPVLDMAEASGRLRFAARDGDVSLAAERLQLRTRDGVAVAPGSFDLRLVATKGERIGGGELKVARLDLTPLAQLAAGLPLADGLRERLALFEPHGRITRLQAQWSGDWRAPAHFSFDTAFEALALRPVGDAPGFAGLSGSVAGSEREGRFKLAVRHGSLSLPTLMPAPEMPLDEARAEGGWSRPEVGAGQARPLEVRLAGLSLRNADVGAEASGLWRGVPGDAGYLELNARAHDGVATAAWKYVPTHVGGVSDWLRQHLLGGVGERATMRLAGDLHKFPFTEPGSGEFRIDVEVRDAHLDFASDWPGFSGLRAHLLFDRDLMRITAREGRFGGVRLRGATVEVANLMDAGNQLMTVRGQAGGPLPDFQTYVQQSALRDTIGPFTRKLEAQGNGELDLRLDLPLHNAEHTRVKGSFRFERATLRLVPGLPPMSEAGADIQFTEHDFTLGEAGAFFLGSRLKVSGGHDADGSQRFVADGVVPVRNLNELVASPLWQQVEGNAAARATVRVRRNLVEVAVDSKLQGVRSRLPPPLDKAATGERALSFVWQLQNGSGNEAQQNWRLRLDGGIDASWQDRCDGDRCVFQRGAVAVGEAASLPERGWRFGGRIASLDLDAWLAALKGGLPAAGGEGVALAGVALEAGEMIGMGYRFRQVSARAVLQGERWVLHLDGPDLAGELRYASEGKGRVFARLSRLTLTHASEDDAPSAASDAAATPEDPQELPALDVVADQFRPHGLDLGRLELQATHSGRDWLLDKIDIGNPDFALTGSGVWRRPLGTRSESRFKLALEARNAGLTLSRFGHPRALLNGKGGLKGEIGWAGAPSTIDYPSLSGRLHLEAEAGQFAKVETGLGRLLGVLSLQALPRRVTLDFRDVFSEGFAFDSLRADLDLSHGVMNTQNLEIRGPAAKVFMRGSTDVARETHKLHITIQPALSEMVAVGAVGVINPLAGVATYLAQKVLRDPVEKLFSFEYEVSGPWADPRIEKTANPLIPNLPGVKK